MLVSYLPSRKQSYTICVGLTSKTYALIGILQTTHQSYGSELQSYGSELQHTVEESYLKQGEKTWHGMVTAGSLWRGEVDIVDFLASGIKEAEIPFESLPGL